MVVSSIELPLVLQDDVDDMNEGLYDAAYVDLCREGRSLYAGTFLWSATPMLDTPGVSTSILRKLYEVLHST